MGSGTSSGTGKPSRSARRRRISRTISWRRRDSAVSAGGSNPTSSRRRRLSSTRISRSSRHGLHDAPYASREAAPPTLFSDLLHALGYLLGRGVWPQFHAHRQVLHPRRLKGLRLRIRLPAEFRMQQAVLIHAPGRDPPLLNKSFGDKRFYA